VIKTKPRAKLFVKDQQILDDLRERISGLLRPAILVKPTIELQQPGSLLVSEGKTQRVLDLRLAF
jgi:phenylacetate-coenzyme A ligase PaaK-like adenylate-forming protein